MEYYGIHHDSVIEHHGIKGQKWGVRRYQNKDGTLTPLGRKKKLGFSFTNPFAKHNKSVCLPLRLAPAQRSNKCR